MPRQWIPCLQVVMKKIYNFLEKPELPKFILPVKISWLIFSAVSGMEMKERSEKSHFLLILCLWLHCMCLSSCSNMNLLAGYLIFAALNSIRPFYSCLLSDLAFEWQRGWR